MPGYFTLFKTLRSMVIYISQKPGIWLIWSPLLSTFARKFVWIVVVMVVGNNMSNSVLIYFLCHFGLFVLVTYRICIERVLKKFPWFYLFIFFLGFFLIDLHKVHWERSFWRGWHDFWGFWLGWSIEFALRERERIPWSLGFWVGWNLYRESVVERNSMTFGCFCWFIEFVLREFWTEWNP